MLGEPIESPEDTSPDALRSRYETALADAVVAVGPDRVAEETDLDEATVESVASGAGGAIDLRDAAAILALRTDAPDTETILSDVRDHLLLEMSSAMLTVDRIAVDVERDLDPKEVQGKVEGRLPMTVAEYAEFHHFIASAK